MKKALALILVLIIAAGGYYFYDVEEAKPVPVGEPTPAPTGEGWINLLDEAHAGAWKNITDDTDIFEIADGMLHIYGVTISPLRYVGYEAERFGDFDLHVEFKFEPGANSGMFVRMQPGDPDRRGFEIQVQDDFGKQPDKNSCGSIYDVVTPMFNMVRPAGEWNSYDISLRGQDVEIVMNGWLIIKTDLSKMVTPLGKFKVAYAEMPLDGLLTFQDHGGEAWYRNLLIKPAK